MTSTETVMKYTMMALGFSSYAEYQRLVDKADKKDFRFRVWEAESGSKEELLVILEAQGRWTGGMTCC